jgi:hypothetical protein
VDARPKEHQRTGTCTASDQFVAEMSRYDKRPKRIEEALPHEPTRYQPKPGCRTHAPAPGTPTASLRCLMIELHFTEIEALVGMGPLKAEMRESQSA